MAVRPERLGLVLLVGAGGAAEPARADSPLSTFSAPQQTAWRYRVSDDQFRWDVHQGGQRAVVRTVGSPEQDGGELVLLAGLDPRRSPVTRVRNLPLLVRVLGGPDSIGPGHISRSVFGETAMLDSLRFALRTGGDPLTIAGHPTTHHLLEVEAWWIDVGQDGSRTPVREVGRADLWFAADLPFSLVPLSMPPPPGASGAALPLSFYHPEVAAHVLKRIKGQLEPLGLLLRSRVVDSIVPGENQTALIQLATMAVQRTITVDSLRRVPDPPSAPEWDDLPVVSPSQEMAIQIGLVSAAEACSDQQANGTFEFSTRGPVGYMGNGVGAAMYGGEGNGRSHLVFRGSNQNVVECTVILFGDSASTPGAYRVVPPSPAWLTASEPRAVVIHILAKPESRTVSRVLVLEHGEVWLDRSDGSGVKGRIQGGGWVVELDPQRPKRLLEGLEFEASFQAVPKATGVDKEDSARSRSGR